MHAPSVRDAGLLTFRSLISFFSLQFCVGCVHAFRKITWNIFYSLKFESIIVIYWNAGVLLLKFGRCRRVRSAFAICSLIAFPFYYYCVCADGRVLYLWVEFEQLLIICYGMERCAEANLSLMGLAFHNRELMQSIELIQVVNYRSRMIIEVNSSYIYNS